MNRYNNIKFIISRVYINKLQTQMYIIELFQLFNVIADSTIDDQKSIDYVKGASTGKDDNTIIFHGLNSSYSLWH